MSNCISCGKYAVEGNMICPNCRTKANKTIADLEQDLRAAHEEIGRLRNDRITCGNALLGGPIK